MTDGPAGSAKGRVVSVSREVLHGPVDVKEVK
jgi:hypothetical protein